MEKRISEKVCGKVEIKMRESGNRREEDLLLRKLSLSLSVTSELWKEGLSHPTKSLLRAQRHLLALVFCETRVYEINPPMCVCECKRKRERVRV